MAGQMDMGAILGEQLLNAAKIMEEQVDQEIRDLEKLDEDDLEAIRRRKLDMMKKMQEKKSEWKAAGHGEYSEIPEEKEFFTVTKGSDKCVVHFYRDETFRCISWTNTSTYSPRSTTRPSSARSTLRSVHSCVT